MSKRVLCIWLPNWPSQRIAVAKWQADPATAPKTLGPILLYARDTRRGQLVVAANSTARAFGIATQMPLSQASTLCPDAEVIEHDPQADMEDLCALAEGAQCFSPIVGIEQIDKQMWAGRSFHQPQSILLDTTGIAPLFGGEEQLANAVQQWLAIQGYFASIAIAGSVGAAWALANYSQRTKIASDMASFERAMTVPHSWSIITILGPNEPAGLATFRLPVESLRLDQATVTKLHRLGIRKVGELVELPRAGLVSRFDEGLLQRIDQVVSQQHEPIVALHALPALAIEQSLEHPTPLRETIDAVIQEQLSKLIEALNQIGHGVIRLVCRITMECNSISLEMEMRDAVAKPAAGAAMDVRIFQIGLYQPSNDLSHLMWLLSGQLDTHLERVKRNQGLGNHWAKSIGIQATLTAPIVWQQASLFERDSLSHKDSISKLIDVLSSRLGRKAVVSPSLQRNPQPELAYAWRPLTGWRRDGQVQQTKRKLARAPKRDFAQDDGLETSLNDSWRRPLRLLQPPQKIEVECIPMSTQPSSLRYRGTVQLIEHSIGPERIDSGWWQGPTQQRDYYRIQLETGTWLWIYRDRKMGCWMLHGEFD